MTYLLLEPILHAQLQLSLFFCLIINFNSKLNKKNFRFLKDKEWSSALCWALRNGSVELISHVAHKVLYYSGASEIAQMRIFDSISESFLITPELLILWKFYNYKRCTLNGKLKEAITILHDLFIDNSAPDSFFVTLLHEMLRLLSTFSDGQFSTVNF